MRFKIPFTFSDIEVLKKRSKFFISRIKYKKDSILGDNLKNCGVSVSREEYMGIVQRTVITNFLFLIVISTPVFLILYPGWFILLALGFSFAFSAFLLFSQLIYPKIYVNRKQRNIEKNLISALEDMLIQINSGIPLFSIMVNISSAGYGELSHAFKIAVKRINAGEPENEVLKDLGKNNPSVFFRRTLWQISNGMVAGSDMGIVVRDTIKALNDEQLIQIQNYGSRLNPLIVMYMLITVIIPTLSITFLTILSSMVNMEKNLAMLMFFSLFIFVVFAQVMFIGIIKSKRPTLI